MAGVLSKLLEETAILDKTLMAPPDSSVDFRPDSTDSMCSAKAPAETTEIPKQKHITVCVQTEIPQTYTETFNFSTKTNGLGVWHKPVHI